MTGETGHRRDPLPTASGGLLDAIERISRTASIAAIPVVLAIGGWTIQRQLQNQTVSRDYVQLALTILQSPDQSKVPPELREWAVELLNDNSPTKLNAKAVANLKSGTVILPSFGFVPSSSLTSELKAELESSLASFQSYMGKLGFSIEARPISVEIVPGVIYKGIAVVLWNPDTASIVVTSAFARDKVSVLRQLAYSSLLTGTIQSPEYSAIESGLATYFPCSFLNHPKVADQASAAGQDVFPLQSLVNSRRFSEIQLEQVASVMNDGSEIWGAAFWQLRELLGQQDADRLLAKTWQDFPRDSQTTSFYASFVDSLVENSKGIRDGSQVEAVRAIFVRRGIDSPRGRK